MTPPRVEPPEGLRDRDGWHWLEAGMEPKPFKWLGGQPGCWHRPLAGGWRYVAPCLTPAEVAALRAERDAAVTRAETLEAGLEELVKLQSHYAWLLNAHDGGLRKQFHSAAEWTDRMDSPSKIKAALAVHRAASPKSKP